MGLKVVKLKDDSEFEELCRVGRKSYETPRLPIWDLYFPMHGSGPAARETAAKEGAQNLAHWYREDPTATWLKVVDEETGVLLGATLWNIFDEAPDAAEFLEDCTWYPAGEQREIANGLVAQFSEPRQRFTSKPHVCQYFVFSSGFELSRMANMLAAVLHIAFTAPSARKRGVMSLLLDWGVKEADRRGFECYLDATSMGNPVYKKFGFVPEKEHHLTMSPFTPTETAREMERQLMPISWWPMYRPAYGKFEEGKTALPWDNLR